MTIVSTEVWGRFQLVVGGTDVTFLRGIPTQVKSWSSGEPFGDSTLQITFPQIRPDEELGSGDLSFLTPWANVELHHVTPNGNRGKTLFEGMVASDSDDLSEQDFGFSVECFGAMFQLDLYVRAPLFLLGEDGPKIADFFNAQFSHGVRPALRTESGVMIEDEPRKDPADDTTAIRTKRTGQWNRALTGYIQDELALCTTRESYPRQYTLTMDHPRTPVLRFKDYETIHYRVEVGTPGVTHGLRQDWTQSTNVIYGEGTDQAGTMWRNSRREGGMSTYEPLAWDRRVHRGTTISGDPIEHEKFDSTVVRSEVHYGYGAGIDLLRGRESAEAQLERDQHPGWIGTISLKSDPPEAFRFEIQAGQNLLYEGFRPKSLSDDDTVRTTTEGLKITTEGRAYDETTDAYVGMLFHIAGAEHDVEQLETTLEVDTKFRDLLSLAELIDRANEGHLDPAKRLRLGRSDVPEDTKEPWSNEDGSGFVPTLSLNGDGEVNGSPSPADAPDQYVEVDAETWVTLQIKAASKATIMRTEVRAFNSDGTRAEVPFHVSFYGHSKVPQDFPSDPFAAGVWDEQLDDPYAGLPSGFIVGWGQNGQRAGFWPGLDSEGDAATGVMIDEGTWQFELDQTLIEPGLWIALWCPQAVYFQGRLHQGVE